MLLGDRASSAGLVEGRVGPVRVMNQGQVVNLVQVRAFPCSSFCFFISFHADSLIDLTCNEAFSPLKPPFRRALLALKIEKMKEKKTFLNFVLLIFIVNHFIVVWRDS